MITNDYSLKLDSLYIGFWAKKLLILDYVFQYLFLNEHFLSS
jgi:hypothetical protein